MTAPTKIEVKRFKDEKTGKEGSFAPMGDGLTKLLFDDGSMYIVREDAQVQRGNR